MADPVNFVRPAAERIARVVRAVEFGSRDGTPLEYERPWDGSSSGISIRLGKTSAAIASGAVGNVVVYSQDANNCAGSQPCEAGEFHVTPTTLCAQNLLANVAANAWVYLVKPAGSKIWHIIGEAAPSQEDSCGTSVVNGVALTFDSCFGEGAAATASVTGDCPGPISSVTIDSPGSGYAVAARVEPELTFTAGGNGATFSATYTETEDACGISTWSIASVSVTGGTGYSDGAKVTITAAAGTVVVSCAELTLTASDGVPTGVTVVDGGEFYKEDLSASPTVATVTVTVTQTPPSAGSGATFTVTVDDDTSSPTFGQITGVAVDDAGDGYVGQVNEHSSVWNGLDFAPITGYDGTKTQMLGHEPGGCLKWFDVTTCEPETMGVCCVEGDAAETTQAACEDVGGTFHLGAKLTDLPGPCCP